METADKSFVGMPYGGGISVLRPAQHRIVAERNHTSLPLDSTHYRMLSFRCQQESSSNVEWRESMPLWHLDRVLGTKGGVHDTSRPTHAGGSPAAQLLRTHHSSLHPYHC